MAPSPPSFELTAVETFRNKNWSRYHRSPHWSRGWWEEGVFRPRVIFPRFQPRWERKGKERERKNKTNFTKSNVSMDQLSKFFHHPPPGGSCTNRFLPHQPVPHPSTRPDHTFLFTLFPPVPEFPEFCGSSVAKKYRDRTLGNKVREIQMESENDPVFTRCRVEIDRILNSSTINRNKEEIVSSLIFSIWNSYI